MKALNILVMYEKDNGNVEIMMMKMKMNGEIYLSFETSQILDCVRM